MDSKEILAKIRKTQLEQWQKLQQQAKIQEEQGKMLSYLKKCMGKNKIEKELINKVRDEFPISSMTQLANFEKKLLIPDWKEAFVRAIISHFFINNIIFKKKLQQSIVRENLKLKEFLTDDVIFQTNMFGNKSGGIQKFQMSSSRFYNLWKGIYNYLFIYLLITEIKYLNITFFVLQKHRMIYQANLML